MSEVPCRLRSHGVSIYTAVGVSAPRRPHLRTKNNVGVNLISDISCCQALLHKAAPYMRVLTHTRVLSALTRVLPA